MASGRRSAGERVLEGRHVIGLFLLMLLFSGVFFTLGYVMGRNQYSGQVNAQNTNIHNLEPSAYVPGPKSQTAAKKNAELPTNDAPVTNPEVPVNRGSWANLGESSKVEPQLEPRPKPTLVLPPPAKTLSQDSKADAPTPSVKNPKSTAAGLLIPSGALLLQVAALSKQDDALEIASSLQRKHFAAYVQPPQKDKFYRVQVGPFKDQKAADAAKKGLEGAGYKAFYVKH